MNVERRFIPWLTYLLLAANVAAFGVELARGASAGTPDTKIMIELGANYAPLTLDGQWWRLFTSMFLHFGLVHIAMNMLCLYQGRMVEEIFGRLGYAAIYLASGLLGSVASIARGKLVVSAGASGAVFGVYGAFLAFLLVRRHKMDPVAWNKMIRSVAMFIGLNFAISLQAKGIDVSAHLGGVVAGFAVGAALVAGPSRRKVTLNELAPPPSAPAPGPRPLRAILAIVASIAISAVAVTVLKVPSAFGALGDNAGLIDRFAKVESESIDRFNAAVGKAKAGQLDDVKLGEVIATEVLPPWSAFGVDLRKASPAKGKEQHVFELLTRYVDTRERAWNTFIVASKSADDAAKSAALDRYKVEWATSVDAAQAFQEELKRTMKSD